MMFLRHRVYVSPYGLAFDSHSREPLYSCDIHPGITGALRCMHKVASYFIQSRDHLSFCRRLRSEGLCGGSGFETFKMPRVRHLRANPLLQPTVQDLKWRRMAWTLIICACCAVGVLGNHPLTQGAPVGPTHPVNVTLALAHHPDDVKLIQQMHRNVSEPGCVRPNGSPRPCEVHCEELTET